MEEPPARRLAVGLKRSAKYFLAACFYYSGLTGLLLARRLRSSKAALILGYHGVQNGATSILSRGHSLKNIAGLLSFLSRHLRPLSLEQIVVPLNEGENPPPGFVLTFDDGLVNNVSLAIPLIKRMRIPATFFVPAGFVGSREDPWPILVREIVYAWPQPTIPAEPGLWPALYLEGDASRFVASHRIKQALKRHEDRRGEVLGRLARPCGSPRAPEGDRVVDVELLRKMVDAGLTVGAHSRSHPILSGLDSSKAEEEITGSRRDLQEILGAEVLDFAYPNGRFPDFDETTRTLVKEAGYRCALTTEPGTVVTGDDPFALRRCMPQDVPAFLTSFDLLLRVWNDGRRPADGRQPLGRRKSQLSLPSVEETM
ncbi:MAG TPA: polysaccharide deacetylase family protein [Candidatus Polarisedimenticolia bacterium]|nr:polysaccharide deacetylase family protein [Candidatus Polarisedimenticolia bacterium]